MRIKKRWKNNQSGGGSRSQQQENQSRYFFSWGKGNDPISTIYSRKHIFGIS